LLETKHRKSIDNPGEEWLSPWATGNERFVAYPDRTAFLGDFRMGGHPPENGRPALNRIQEWHEQYEHLNEANW
jgi:hypothetical protein